MQTYHPNYTHPMPVAAFLSTAPSRSNELPPGPLTSDPQFWIVTIIALAALVFILRALLPKLGLKRAKGTSTPAQLTIERRKPE